MLVSNCDGVRPLKQTVIPKIPEVYNQKNQLCQTNVHLTVLSNTKVNYEHVNLAHYLCVWRIFTADLGHLWVFCGTVQIKVV